MKQFIYEFKPLDIAKKFFLADQKSKKRREIKKKDSQI